MVSTYTNTIRATKQGTGDNPNTWGKVLNEQVFNMLDTAINGVKEVSVSGSTDVTLTTANGLEDQARSAVLVLTGVLTGNIDLLIPAVSKKYFIRGAWTGEYTVSVKIEGSTSEVVLNTGDKKIVYVDGVDIYDMLPPAIEPYDVGDIVPTFLSTAKTGWMLLVGNTLGSSASSATLKGATYEAVYKWLWNNIANTECPVGGGRGASADADWSANKILTSPNLADRTAFGIGSTWTRAAQVQGSETISKDNLPNETLSVTGTISSDGAHTHTVYGNTFGFDGTNPNSRTSLDTASGTPNNKATSSNGAHTHTFSGGETEALGSGAPFVPKGFGVNWMMKI